MFVNGYIILINLVVKNKENFNLYNKISGTLVCPLN